MAKIGEISDNPNLNLTPTLSKREVREEAFRTFAEGCFAVEGRGIEAKILCLKLLCAGRQRLQRIAPTTVEIPMDPESPIKK
jgi:hypothetical protein